MYWQYFAGYMKENNSIDKSLDRYLVTYVLRLQTIACGKLFGWGNTFINLKSASITLSP